MKKNEKARKSSKPILIVVFAVIVVLLLLNFYLIGGLDDFAGLWPSNGADRETPAVTNTDSPPAGAQIAEGQMGVTPLPDETLPSGPVKVTTAEYELTYSELMADVIRVEQLEGEHGTDLAFYATLSDGEALLFIMRYNVNEGGFIHRVMTNELGEVPFCFEMAEAPEDLGDTDQYTFYGAQEIINDIMHSLALRQNE